MASPKIKTGEFSYADYLRWPEQERWQLLDGFAFAMAPPNIAHQIVVSEFGRQLGNQLIGKPCKALVAPVGVRLPKAKEADKDIRNVFEPDVLVVCDPNKIDKAGVRGAPDFIVEVLSPSTASFDQIEKRAAYEKAGVRELWLVDAAGGVLTIYRALARASDTDAHSFAPPQFARAEGIIALEALPGIILDLDFMRELREVAEEFS
jgi:Uma2 family endonuclease